MADDNKTIVEQLASTLQGTVTASGGAPNPTPGQSPETQPGQEPNPELNPTNQAFAKMRVDLKASADKNAALEKQILDLQAKIEALGKTQPQQQPQQQPVTQPTQVDNETKTRIDNLEKRLQEDQQNQLRASKLQEIDKVVKEFGLNRDQLLDFADKASKNGMDITKPGVNVRNAYVVINQDNIVKAKVDEEVKRIYKTLQERGINVQTAAPKAGPSNGGTGAQIDMSNPNEVAKAIMERISPKK